MTRRSGRDAAKMTYRGLWIIFGSLAVMFAAFGPVGLLAMVVIVAGNALVAPLSPALVLVWARLSRTPFRDSGFVRPEMGRRRSPAASSGASR